MLNRTLIFFMLMTHLAVAASVPVETSEFARQEVTRLVRLMDKERLVSFTRAGTLILGSPSAEVTEALAALGDSCVEPLSEQFASARFDGVRYGIGVALAARGAAGEQALLKLLRTAGLKGRRWLLQALGGKTSGPIVAALRQLVSDPDRELAERAVLDLAESEDDQGLVILRGLVRTRDRALAKKAALALALQKDASGIDILLDDLKAAKGGALALFQTMRCLGLSGAPEAVAPLCATLAAHASRIEEDEPPGRVTGLGDFEARFRKMPASERAMLVAGHAAGALAGLSHRGPRAEVLELLAHANSGVRRMAVEVLGAVGDASAAPALVRVVDSHDAELAVAAAQSLRNIAAPSTRAGLTAARKRAPRPLDDWIALALAALNDEAGVRRAVQLARGEGDIPLAAITTLGTSTAPAAIDHLVTLMSLGEPQMQLLAASSLSRPGNVHARRPLAALLARGRQDNDPQRLGVAALGLGLVGDQAAVKTLEELAHASDRSVRRAAVVGLYYLTGEARRYRNVWGEEVRFEPTTFHMKMRQETTASAPRQDQ